ncbi:MAG: polysaccharide pyruvyl transferase family protein [Acidobacteriota bacterium]
MSANDARDIHPEIAFTSFAYGFSRNLGDHLQSFAAEQFLPRIDGHIDRESMRDFSPADARPHLLLMNGWFAHAPEKCLPAARAILPVFVGFHMTEWDRARRVFSTPDCLAYFKRHEPIGCRDRSTAEALETLGVATHYTMCLTLTFPRRAKAPRDPRTLIVDADHLPIPESIRQEAVVLTHEIPYRLSEDHKRAIARSRLDLYRDRAERVITTRLHCALPCLAMGIPVVFFGNPRDARFSILHDLGVPIYSNINRSNERSALRLLREVCWTPEVLDVEDVKRTLRGWTEVRIAERIAAAATCKAIDGASDD